MPEAYEDDKGWSEEVKDKHGSIVPHITKVGRTKYQGMPNYSNPPRIGIDFNRYETNEHNYIPNLDLADVATLLRMLELVQQEDVSNKIRSRKIKPFEIWLSFSKDMKRKITLDVGTDHLVIAYQGYHNEQQIDFDHNLSREGVDRLIRSLKTLLVEYQSAILKYVMIGDLDEKFK